MENVAMGQKSMHLEVDEALCTSCGLCEERAPDNITSDEGVAVAQVMKQPVGEVETASCNEAVDYCPTGGLTASPDEESEDAA